MIWIVLIVLLVALWFWPRLMEARRGRPDPRQAPGKFVDLSQGRTHYRWIGPVRGPVVVAIHGLMTPSEVWDGIGEGLASFGYRVLVYDLYGRGYSEPVSGHQDADFFIQQLEDLLEDQGLVDDLTVVGYSMGGAIATAFGARHPGRLKRLILLAPAGIEGEEDRLYRFMRTWPLLGSWLHGVYEPIRARAAILTGRDPQSEMPEMAQVQLRQLGQSGFFPASLSSRKGVLSDRQIREHQRLGKEDVPVIAIWAEDDPVIPIKGLGTLAQWNRNVRQEVVEGASHGLVHTHVTAVLEVLRNVLREN